MSERAERHLRLFQEGGIHRLLLLLGGVVSSSKGPHGLKSFEFRSGDGRGVRSPKKIDQEEKWDVDASNLQARITAGSNTETPE